MFQPDPNQKCESQTKSYPLALTGTGVPPHTLAVATATQAHDLKGVLQIGDNVPMTPQISAGKISVSLSWSVEDRDVEAMCRLVRQPVVIRHEVEVIEPACLQFLKNNNIHMEPEHYNLTAWGLLCLRGRVVWPLVSELYLFVLMGRVVLGAKQMRCLHYWVLGRIQQTNEYYSYDHVWKKNRT